MVDLPESLLCLSTPLVDVTYVPQSALLYTVIKSEETYDVPAVKSIMESEMQLVGGDRHAQIVSFTSGFISPTKEAREFSAGVLSKLNRTSVAFVVEQLPVRLVLNSFIIFNKPPIPTKMFSTVTEAEKWSIEQLKKDS